MKNLLTMQAEVHLPYYVHAAGYSKKLRELIGELNENDPTPYRFFHKTVHLNLSRPPHLESCDFFIYSQCLPVKLDGNPDFWKNEPTSTDTTQPLPQEMYITQSLLDIFAAQMRKLLKRLPPQSCLNSYYCFRKENRVLFLPH